MTLAGLLTKIADRLDTEITSRGLTAYFLKDLDYGPNDSQKQDALANALRTRGVNVIDITDTKNATIDNRGILIVFGRDEKWFQREGVITKLKKATQVKAILTINSHFPFEKRPNPIENFEVMSTFDPSDGKQSEHLIVFKRVQVYT